MDRSLKYFDELEAGNTFPEYNFEITEKIADKYFNAIEEDKYFDTKNKKIIMPPTFASVFATGCYKKFIENPEGTLHTKQEYKIHQELYVGDTIKIKGSIIEKYEKKGNNYIVFEALAKKDNKTVLTSKATLLWGKKE
jgi:hypothetical protein